MVFSSAFPSFSSSSFTNSGILYYHNEYHLSPEGNVSIYDIYNIISYSLTSNAEICHPHIIYVGFYYKTYKKTGQGSKKVWAEKYGLIRIKWQKYIRIHLTKKRKKISLST